ncbi:MAG: ankyrin repeat domain-containing protein [Oligoflexia bacterium]|nr:ankyrin repeat domain-containing protein [Oligoflexia bacterium]
MYFKVTFFLLTVLCITMPFKLIAAAAGAAAHDSKYDRPKYDRPKYDRPKYDRPDNEDEKDRSEDNFQFLLEHSLSNEAAPLEITGISHKPAAAATAGAAATSAGEDGQLADQSGDLSPASPAIGSRPSINHWPMILPASFCSSASASHRTPEELQEDYRDFLRIRSLSISSPLGRPVPCDVNGNTDLHIAAMATNIPELLVEVIDRYATLNTDHEQSQLGHRSHEEILLFINHKNDHGLTALHCAVQYVHPNLVSVLIKAGASQLIQDNTGRTPLIIAVENYSLIMQDPRKIMSSEEIQRLEYLNRCEKAKNLEDVSQIGELQQLRQKEQHISNHKKILLQLLSTCPRAISIADVHGDNILHIALRVNDSEIISSIQNKISSDTPFELWKKRNRRGITPLSIATQMGILNWARNVFLQLSVKDRLFILCAEEDRDGNTIFHHAAQSTEPDMLLFFMGQCRKCRHGFQSLSNVSTAFNRPNKSGKTPVHTLVEEGHFLSLQAVCDDEGRVANLDAQDLNGDTPLILAAKNGHENAAVLLLKKGINFNQQNVKQQTALFIACGRGDISFALRLLAVGARQEIIDQGGQIALHQAVLRGNQDLVRSLILARSNINAQDYRGFTPLHLAAIKGHVSIAALLLSHGADISIRSFAGESCLDIVKKGDLHETIAKQLTDLFEQAEGRANQGGCEVM